MQHGDGDVLAASDAPLLRWRAGVGIPSAQHHRTRLCRSSPYQSLARRSISSCFRLNLIQLDTDQHFANCECIKLQDILLVTASVIIMGTDITFLQIFGYGVALVGLVLFKTSGNKK